MGMIHLLRRVGIALSICFTTGANTYVYAQDKGVVVTPSGASANAIKPTDAPRLDDPSAMMVLGAATAGHRMVAVGESGLVLLSDDSGAHFRQAQHVPVNSTLTSVTFVDEKRGWAVGHWGSILRTEDGGENWSLQRIDTSVDQPIFSVSFSDAKHGWAVGLWSLLLTTEDGGVTWKSIKHSQTGESGKSDQNLYSVFHGKKQDVFIAAEQGTVLKSVDGGATWTALKTGYKGTLWTGTVSPDGVIYVGGLRGNLYESRDEGRTWARVVTNAAGSITDLVTTTTGVVGVTLDGVVMSRKVGNSDFATQRLPRHDELTAVAVVADGKPILFSKLGVVTQ